MNLKSAVVLLCAFGLSVFSCGIASGERHVPRFRQEMARRLKTDVAVLDALSARAAVLDQKLQSELGEANRVYEREMTATNLLAIAALTNDLPQCYANIAKFRSDGFGFGELFLLVDAAWERVRQPVMAQDLAEAIRIRNEISLCKRVMYTGLAMLVEEHKAPNVYRAFAKEAARKNETFYLPKCQSNDFVRSSSLYREALEADRLGRRVADLGEWASASNQLLQASLKFEQALNAAIFDGL